MSEYSVQNIICPSCDELPCLQIYEDCQEDLFQICEGCGNCPCTKEYEDCEP